MGDAVGGGAVTRDEARRRAEEALAKTALLGPIAPASSTWVSVRADDLAALLAGRPGHDRIGELEALLRECNAVCLCGCPDSEHEADECGESCGHDDHECIRVAPAVLAYVDKLRSDLAPAAPDELRKAAEEALGVLTDLAESAAYWSEYDVPLGIVSRVDFAKARLAGVLK